MKYQDYLLSRQWQTIRNEMFRRHGDACLGCGSFFMVQAHHVFYPRFIQDTTVDHVIPICWKCHKALHQSELGATVSREEFIEPKKSEIIAHLKNQTRVTYNQWEAHDKGRYLREKQGREKEQAEREREEIAKEKGQALAFRADLIEQACLKTDYSMEQLKSMTNHSIVCALRGTNAFKVIGKIKYQTPKADRGDGDFPLKIRGEY